MNAPFDLAALPDQDIIKLKHAIEEVRGWLDLKLKTGRYSFGFVMELVYHGINRLYDVHAIYDEIGKLEGTDERPSITKPAEPFKRGALCGLWHKHHHQTCFLATNLKLELRRPGAVDALTPYIGRCVHEIAHAMTVGVHEKRAGQGRMTGEWIVFEKEEGTNYYLTLGQHRDDENIRARVDAYRQVDNELAAAAGRSPT